MRVQVVEDENPRPQRVEVHGSRDVCHELGFLASFLERGRKNLTRDHIETGGQRGRAMPRIFELLPGHATGLSGLVGGVAFGGLQRRRLVHAHRVSAVDCGFSRRIEVRLANRSDLTFEGFGVLFLRVELHFLAMRLHGRLQQIAAHLRDRDALDNLAFEHLVV